MAARNPNSLQHLLLSKHLCSLSSLKWNRFWQLKTEIKSRAHPAKPVVVENGVTMSNFIAGFWGHECPQFTNDLCPAIVETRLDSTVNCPTILPTVGFANGLGAGTDFASWNAVINVLFCNERGCNIKRASAVDIKGSTENDEVCIKQWHLNTGVQRNCV